MSALSYLLRKQLKNSLLNFIKQPSKLIIGVVFIGLLAVSFIPSDTATATEAFRNVGELYAEILALFAVFFVLMAYKGFGSGASMYTMADVNLLFETPVKSTRILAYGVLRQVGIALLMCLFILYQYATLHNIYGVSFAFVIVILFCFAAVIVCGQMTAMLIYSQTSADDAKRKKWQAGFYAVFLIFAAMMVYRIFSLKSGNVLNDAVSVFNADWVSAFPVIGWMRAVTVGIHTGALLPLVLGLGATAAFAAAVLWFIAKTDTDYYEDVLAATEVSHNVITARKEGKLNEVVPKHIKVGKTGIGAGSGASAIFHKQKLERRRGRFFIVDANALIFIVITIAVALFTSMSISVSETSDSSAQAQDTVQSESQVSADEAESEPSAWDDVDTAVITALSMSVYMQMFSAVMGRFAKELALPYIYMIPEPPFKKLVQCLRENLLSLVVEGLLLWIPMMFFVKMDVPTVLFCIAARVSYGYLFVASNIFLERFLGGLPKFFSTMFYFILATLMAVPGIVVGIIAGNALNSLLGFPVLLAVILVAVLVNLAVTALSVFASRNMLIYAELNNA